MKRLGRPPEVEIQRQPPRTVDELEFIGARGEEMAPKAEAIRYGPAVGMGKRAARHGIVHVAIVLGEEVVEAEPGENQEK